MKSQNRKLIVIFAVGMLLASQRAMAATISGSYALGLASVIAVHSPVLSRAEKRVMARLFNGNSNVAFPAARKISVRADALVCVESDMDPTLNSCALTFGANSVRINGGAAHELFATVAEANVRPDFRASLIFERLSNLVCIINPHAIAQNNGGGADCSFHPGR